MNFEQFLNKPYRNNKAVIRFNTSFIDAQNAKGILKRGFEDISAENYDYSHQERALAIVLRDGNTSFHLGLLITTIIYVDSLSHEQREEIGLTYDDSCLKQLYQENLSVLLEI